MTQKSVCVIGGGISGLATAFWLKELDINVWLLEKNSRTGGVIQTARENGYLFEQGPNSFLDNAPDTLDLCYELNLDNELLKQSLRGNPRYIYLNGKLHEVPTGPGGLFKTEIFSKKAKRRLFTEPFRSANRSKEDESLASFIRRRLGNEILDHAVTPFVSGVYAGDPEKLSLRGTFPLMYDLERQHGSLIGGMIKRMFRKKKKNSQEEEKKPRAKNLCSFVDGMETMTQALAQALGDRVWLNNDVQKIEKTEKGFRINRVQEDPIEFDMLVLATPAYALPHMVSELLPESCQYGSTIPYNRLCLMGLGYKKDEIENACEGFGFLSPRNQDIRILGSIFNSSLFARRAPAGTRCFSVFIGGGLDPAVYDLSDDEIKQQCKNDLQHVLEIHGDPTYEKLVRWEKAIPQYPIGHVNQTEIIQNELQNYPNLFLTGNYFDGVSFNDCIRNARKTANEVRSRIEA